MIEKAPTVVPWGTRVFSAVFNGESQRALECIGYKLQCCKIRKPMSSKTELYESLYSLNAGIEEALRALVRMQHAGLLLPFIDGNVLMMESLRKWIHEGVIGIMTDAERMEWEEYAQARRISDRALRLFGNDAGTVV